MDPGDYGFLWRFLVPGYLVTVALETAVLWPGLSPRYPARTRLLAGLWLTACTYPIVVLALPPLFAPEQRWAYLLAAETFAPAAECALFSLAWHAGVPRRERLRDWLAIIAANLVSYLAGEAYWALTGGR